MQLDFDVIIVGAGSAGCVLANCLSGNPKRRVLLIESGPVDGGLFMTLPRGAARLFRPGNRQVSFYQASQGGNGAEETWMKGHTLGGSSSINGMVYMRGIPTDYDDWASSGCPGWGWNEIGAQFRALEDHVFGATAWRGSGGPLKVSVNREHTPLSEDLIRAAEATGTPRLDDINDIRAESTGGFGYQPYTTRRGRRWSAASAFLRPVRGRPNLTVLTERRVTRILFEGRRAVGLVVDRDSDTKSYKAHEIILSAGAIETPKLLQLSGVGPAAILRSLDIDVVADISEVGRNLIEHRYFSLQYQVRSGSSNAQHRGLGLARALLDWSLRRKGVLTHGTFDLGGLVKTDPALGAPDAQVGVGLYSLRFDRGRTETWDRPGITVGGYFLRPESRGETHIRSANPNEAPYINANYLATEADRLGSVRLFRWIRQLVKQPALSHYAPVEISPGADVLTDDAIIDTILRLGSSGLHVAGTCRMGSDENSVVDPNLRVRGVGGLRIMDTSVMPTLISGNTNGPVMAMALRAADLINRTL